MIFEFNNFPLFFLSAILLNLSPGNDMLFAVSRTLSHGIRGGVFALAGLFLGCMIHVVFATAGLSAIIMKFSVTYNIIRYAGAGYLIYLGIASVLKGRTGTTGTGEKAVSSNKLILQGMTTDILNPKVALFFLAFLPQFVSPSGGDIWFQLLTLGTLFNLIGTILFLGIIIFVGKTSGALKNTLFWRCRDQITGTILFGLGLNIALKK